MALFHRLSCNRLLSIGGAATILHLFSALTFINAKVEMVSPTASPLLMTLDKAINENYANAVNSLTNDVSSSGISGSGSWLDANMQKRSWQQLQGAWGKRAMANGGWNIEPTDDNSIIAERWIPIVTASGGPFATKEDHPEILKYSLIYLTNGDTLDQLANKQQHQVFEANSNEDGTIDDDLLASMDVSDNDNILNEKRNWKSMNAAWGKRRNAPSWNKFRGM